MVDEIKKEVEKTFGPIDSDGARKAYCYLLRKFTTCSLLEISELSNASVVKVENYISHCKDVLQLHDNTDFGAALKKTVVSFERMNRKGESSKTPSVGQRLDGLETAVRAGLAGTLAFMAFVCIGLVQPVIAKMTTVEQHIAGATVFALGMVSIGSWAWAACAMRSARRGTHAGKEM